MPEKSAGEPLEILGAGPAGLSASPVIGSTNFDFRSFEMNAECNFVIKDSETGGRMESQYEEDVAKSQEIHPLEWKRRFFLHRALDGAARRLAPLL